MPEEYSRRRASDLTAALNLARIMREQGGPGAYDRDAEIASYNLRKELRGIKGLEGFRKGGRVKRTGIYRLHKGERVIPARSKRRGRR